MPKPSQFQIVGSSLVVMLLALILTGCAPESVDDSDATPEIVGTATDDVIATDEATPTPIPSTEKPPTETATAIPTTTIPPTETATAMPTTSVPPTATVKQIQNWVIKTILFPDDNGPEDVCEWDWAVE
jgi:hypothetical protein